MSDFRKVEFRELIERALEIWQQYARLEQARYGRSWKTDEIALGFVGDVGDLAKLVLAQSGVRAIPESRDKLAHELSDCLWSIIVLADRYDIDLETAFLKTMAALEMHITDQNSGG